MPNKGFTMIELLLVIIIVGSLAASAMPNFLDFRNDGRLAMISNILANWRVGLKMQKQQMIMRCGQPASAWPPTRNIFYNDVTNFGAQCSTTQIPVADERRLIASATHPANPYLPPGNDVWGGCTGATCIAGCAGANCTDHCSDPTGACGNGGSQAYGWCYSPATGEIWTSTQLSTSSTKECTL